MEMNREMVSLDLTFGVFRKRNHAGEDFIKRGKQSTVRKCYFCCINVGTSMGVGGANAEKRTLAEP